MMNKCYMTPQYGWPQFSTSFKAKKDEIKYRHMLKGLTGRHTMFLLF